MYLASSVIGSLNQEHVGSIIIVFNYWSKQVKILIAVLFYKSFGGSLCDSYSFSICCVLIIIMPRCNYY